jgi:hypothetical protein
MTRNGIIVGASVAGLAVLSFLIGSSILNSGRIATIDGFQRTADPTKIVVVVTIGLLDDFADRTVIEDETAVKITLRVRSRAGSQGVPALGVSLPVTLSLREPLGTRSVIDNTGRAIPDLGTYRALPLPSP